MSLLRGRKLELSLQGGEQGQGPLEIKFIKRRTQCLSRRAQHHQALQCWLVQGTTLQRLLQPGRSFSSAA